MFYTAKVAILEIFILILCVSNTSILYGQEKLSDLPLVIVQKDSFLGGYEDDKGNPLSLSEVWKYTATIPENQRSVARSRTALIGSYGSLSLMLGSLTALLVIQLSDYRYQDLKLALSIAAISTLFTTPIFESISIINTQKAVRVYNIRKSNTGANNDN